jgi:uncharacterized membrane protein
MTEEPVTAEAAASLAIEQGKVIEQLVYQAFAQNLLLRALLRDLVATDPTLIERLAVLAQPDLAASAPGVSDSFAAILAGVGGEEAETGH